MLDREDHLFKLTIDPDTSKVDKALKEMGMDMAALGKSAFGYVDPMMAKLSAGLRAQQASTGRGQAIGNAIGTAAGRGLSGLGAAGSSLGSLAMSAVPGLGSLAGGLAGGGLGMAVGGMQTAVSKASPAAMERFMLVLDDISGVIGQTLLPVFEIMTDAFKLFGDVLATILPSTKEMNTALAPLREGLDKLSAAFRGLVAEVGPMLRDLLIDELGALAKVLGELLEVVGPLVPVMTAFLKGFIEVARYTTVLGLLGTLMSSNQRSQSGMRSSTGAAVRGVGITDLASYRNQLQIEAYRASISPAERAANSLETIETQVNVIAGRVGRNDHGTGEAARG